MFYSPWMGHPQLRSSQLAPFSAAILAAATPSLIWLVAIWKPASTCCNGL